MTFFVEGLSRVHGSEGQVRHVGEYETLDDAIAAAKRMIDEFLGRQFEPGMSPKVLFSVYQNLGEFPVIFRDDDRTYNVRAFNHFGYAMTRCNEMCGGKKKD